MYFFEMLSNLFSEESRNKNIYIKKTGSKSMKKKPLNQLNEYDLIFFHAYYIMYFFKGVFLLDRFVYCLR